MTNPVNLISSRMLRTLGSGARAGHRPIGIYLALPTVTTHVSGILAKLGLNNRVQIALLVHDAGLLDRAVGQANRPVD
jgi:DNA-binding CsgD family transcriptional regulator